MTADSKAKLKELQENVVKESEKKRITINCKKTGCMVVSKRENASCNLCIGDGKIDQVQKFNYLENVLTNNGKCDRNPKADIDSERYLRETEQIEMKISL